VQETEEPAWQAVIARPTASMVLPTPGGGEEADVGLGRDEPERGEVADLAGVQVGLEGDVEGVQALVVGQARQLQGVVDPAAFAHADCFLEDQVEEVQVAHGGLLGPGAEGVEVAGEVGEVEPFGRARGCGWRPGPLMRGLRRGRRWPGCGGRPAPGRPGAGPSR